MFAITGFRYIEVFFRYILLLLGLGISFVIPRSSLNRGSLNRGFTVLRSCIFFFKRGNFE